MAEAWPERSQLRVLDHPIERRDGPDKVSGRARYTHDIRLPGMLYAVILPSPHAHARVVSIDTSIADRRPGVQAIVTYVGQELKYQGDPVAAVAATTVEKAEDAVRALRVRYDVLPHAVTMEQSMAPNAPPVFADGNVRSVETHGDKSQAEAAFAGCAAEVEDLFTSPFHHHTCLETHGVVVDYQGDHATVYASTQGTFTIPKDAAQHLNLPEDKVRSVVQYMGGGFGSKFGLDVPGRVACELALKARKPVHLMLTRAQEFVMAGNGSGTWQKLRLGADASGRFKAMTAEQRKFGGLADGSLRGMPYIYDVETAYRSIDTVHMNIDGTRPFQAPGSPDASFPMESIIDDLAARLNLDPLEVRLTNLQDGHEFYERQARRGAQVIGWARRNRQIPPGPVKRGMGMAVSQWNGGGRPGCQVTVLIAPSGAVQVRVGTQDLGTGTRTYVAAVVAEALGLRPMEVEPYIGDSTYGNAGASGGSTTSASLSPALWDAAVKARQALFTRIAPVLGAQPADLAARDGQVIAPGRTVSWKQACSALGTQGVEARGEFQPGLSDHGVHGVQFAEVEVDTRTGHVQVLKLVAVQDCGLPLNRKAIESQLNGGMTRGLGFALLEGKVTDADLGLMLNTNFEFYKVPGAREMPEFVGLIDDGDTRAVIGMAEAAIVPTASCIANAVFNACGARVRSMPMTPDKVLAAAAGGARVKAFELHHPTSVREAGRLLSEGHSQALAGGIDLLGELKDYLATPDRVIDLKRIPNLDRIESDNGLTVGALVKLQTLADHARVRTHYAAYAQAAESVGSPQIRHVGTVGGNLCQRPRCWYYRNENVHCLKKGGSMCYAAAESGQTKYHAILGGGPSYIVHPSDTAPALVVLDATVQTGGCRERRIAIEKFFTLPAEARITQEHVLEPGEIVTAIYLPPTRARSIYLKFREKETMDWALVSVALAVEEHGGRVTACRIALGGVAPVPWRARHAERLLVGGSLRDAAHVRRAAEATTEGASPLPHNGYKIPLVHAVFEQAVAQLIGGSHG